MKNKAKKIIAEIIINTLRGGVLIGVLVGTMFFGELVCRIAGVG